jgi:hypothetical protein
MNILSPHDKMLNVVTNSEMWTCFDIIFMTGIDNNCFLYFTVLSLL